MALSTKTPNKASPVIKHRFRFALACFIKKYYRQLCNPPTASLKLTVRVFKAEVTDTLRTNACMMTGTLGQDHYAKLRTLHHHLLLRAIRFSRRQRSDHLLSYPKALKQTQPESVETVIRKRRLLFAGVLGRKHLRRLPRRVTFGALCGEDTSIPGSPDKNWLRCLSDDL